MNRFAVIILIIMIQAGISAGFAQYEDKFMGAGFTVGRPGGITFKKWHDDRISYAALISISEDKDSKFVLQTEVSKHFFDVSGFDYGSFALYVSGGLTFRAVEENVKDSGFTLGIRPAGGLVYFLPDILSEVFFEVGPLFDVLPGFEAFFTGGAGMRFYF